MAKVEPAVLDLRFALSSTDTWYIDLAKALSQVNRRLYRQGRCYYVAGISLMCDANLDPAAATNKAYVQTAPDSWITHNAWTKAFNLWNDQQKDAAKATGIRRGKWADFKLYLDDDHRASGGGISVGATHDGDASSAIVLAPEAWDYAQIIYSDDDGTSGVPVIREPFLHLIGADNGTTSVGIIEHYEESRRTVQSEDPNVPAEASSSIFAKVADHDDTMITIVNDLESQNDNPPYDVNQYPGGADNANHPHLVALAATLGGAGATKGFKAPCGLITIRPTAAMDVIVHLMPGTYRGVMATPMGQ